MSEAATKDDPVAEPSIGLALSGGGSRAIAFHLGCLRALHDLGILGRVKVLSTVSGGSVIGALYAATDAPFPEFEDRVRTLLLRGLFRPAVRTAFTTLEGVNAIWCSVLVGCVNLIIVVLNWAVWLLSLFASPQSPTQWRHEGWASPVDVLG